MAEFTYKTTGTASGGAVLTEGGFTLEKSDTTPTEVTLGEIALTPGAQFENSIEWMLESRSGYDGLDRHEVAHRAARVTGYTELEIYNVLIAVKDARADIAAERGEFHADSAHDAACYRKLKADYIAGK